MLGCLIIEFGNSSLVGQLEFGWANNVEREELSAFFEVEFFVSIPFNELDKLLTGFLTQHFSLQFLSSFGTIP